jgi:hypothetical protein
MVPLQQLLEALLTCHTSVLVTEIDNLKQATPCMYACSALVEPYCHASRMHCPNGDPALAQHNTTADMAPTVLHHHFVKPAGAS